MLDFTQAIFKVLLQNLKTHGWNFITFHEKIMGNNLPDKHCILRHDIDLLPNHALDIAYIEHSLGLKASYYFRVIPKSYDEKIIQRIKELGHEIGYHYEDLSLCHGDYIKAIKHFEQQLKRLRKFYPVKTICMHGSPLSKWDNRDLWKKYNYRDFGIVAEPYFDIDFNELFYLTDTGRRWDGDSVSVRDKVGTDSFSHHRFRTTRDIIDVTRNNLLPDKIMITTHPQRWNDNLLPWTKELILQNFKNVIKGIVIKNKKIAKTISS